MIIEAPSDNDEQKEFLGYTWSNRKGQEGIDIKSTCPDKYCGKLYHADDISLAAVIQNSFYSIYDDVTEYCFISETKNLLNFETAKFTKKINLSRNQKIIKKEGYNIYSFNDSKKFNLSIGKRVFNKDIVDNGNIPVISANVYKEFGKININDENIRKYNKEVVIWGIDGDWGVHITKSDYVFYPTDHCGVLEIITDELLPQYVKYALYATGINQRFSRSNRASTQKIKELKIQAPDIKLQQNIIHELNAIEQKIIDAQNNISSYYDMIKSEFIKIVGTNSDQVSLGDIANIEKGGNLTRQQAISGEVPVIAGGINPSCYHNVANRKANVITVSASGQNAGYVNFWSIPIFATDYNTILVKNEQEYAIEFIYVALLHKQNEIFAFQEGSAQPHVYSDDLKKLQIQKISKSKQDNFVTFFRKHEKEKQKADKELIALETKKMELIKKYFD